MSNFCPTSDDQLWNLDHIVCTKYSTSKMRWEVHTVGGQMHEVSADAAHKFRRTAMWNDLGGIVFWGIALACVVVGTAKLRDK